MKIKSLLVILTLLCSASCTHKIERDNGSVHKVYTIEHISRAMAEKIADEKYAEDVKRYEAKKKAEEERKTADAEWKREEAAKYAKLKKVFDKEIAEVKCYKEKWSKYEFGDYFQKLANKHGISAYDVALGDQYTKRNITPYLQAEALNNYFTYVAAHFSEAEKAVYNNEGSNKKMLFNKITQKDYNCYQKLK